MNRPSIITIAGKARHGKDSSAFFLENQLKTKGFKVKTVHYADTLKFILKQYFNWNGLKDKNGRSLLQKVGEEARKKEPDFWIRLLAKIINNIFSDYDYIIIADCRYPNEILYWEDVSQLALTIKVIRNNYISELTKEQQNHHSETALDNFNFHYTITASNLFELENEVKKLIKEQFEE